jgi:transposase
VKKSHSFVILSREDGQGPPATTLLGDPSLSLRGCEEIADAVENANSSYDRVMDENEQGAARTVEANRGQMRWVTVDLEGMLSEDHPARAVWAYVERLDLSAFYARIGSREGSAGRPAIDPRILLSLWIVATLDGVGAAREIERLCEHHLAYQWICGGVSVNYHTLSDFRNLSADLLNGVLTQSVTLLLNAGLVELRRVAQDGMKVRASAGASSFRSKGRLRQLEKIAREQVEELAREIEDDPGAASKRQQSARQRAAEGRQRRIEQAVEQMKEAEKRKRSNNGKKKTEPRSSTTDPSARVMKMPDGGFRPAYNVHLATTTESRVIVGVEVNNQGTDLQMMVPLADQIDERFGQRVQEWLADGGCTSVENINGMEQKGCKVFAPLRKRQNPERKPADARASDSDAVRQWRARMDTEEGKQIYKQRGATAEWANAQLRQQGLARLLVRGINKVLSVVLVHAITNNMRRSWAFA